VGQYSAPIDTDSGDRGLRRLDSNLCSACEPVGMAGTVNQVASQTEIAKYARDGHVAAHLVSPDPP